MKTTISLTERVLRLVVIFILMIPLLASIPPDHIVRGSRDIDYPDEALG